MNNNDFMARLETDRTIAVVRAPDIADAADLCRALVAGGISGFELTYTTPPPAQACGPRRGNRGRARCRGGRGHSPDRRTGQGSH